MPQILEALPSGLIAEREPRSLAATLGGGGKHQFPTFPNDVQCSWMDGRKVITLIRGFLSECELLEARDIALNAIFCLITVELLHMGRDD